MEYEADIRFVDPHAERDGRHHHHAVLPGEAVLVLLAYRMVESGMIGQGVDALGDKQVGHVLDLLA